MFISCFVHGFERPDFPVPPGPRACLVLLGVDGVHDILDLPFPRFPSDFDGLEVPVMVEDVGDAVDYRPLPRFGLTGLAVEDDIVYAGSWNGV